MIGESAAEELTGFRRHRDGDGSIWFSCLLCGHTLESSKFTHSLKNYAHSHRKRAVCDDCWLNGEPEEVQSETLLARLIASDHRLRKKYGIGQADFMKMLEDQNFTCVICHEVLNHDIFQTRETPNKPHVDHCHTTGKVRAILCSSCNVALGHARENPKILMSMIVYLHKHVDEEGTFASFDP